LAGARTRAIQVSVVGCPPQAPPHVTFVDLRTGGYGRPAGAGESLIGAPLLVWDKTPGDRRPADPARGLRTIRLVRTNLPWATDTSLIKTVRSFDGYTDRTMNLLRALSVRNVRFAQLDSGVRGRWPQERFRTCWSGNGAGPAGVDEAVHDERS
jgi:hypothetical protein